MESRKKSLYIKNMKVLVLDLYESYHTDPEQFVAYHRNSNHYDFMRERYHEDRYADNPHISFDAFVGCVDLLHEGGYIVHSKGGHFYNSELGEYGFLSRMRATKKLLALWMSYRITPDMVRRFREPEVIIQKDKPTPKVINKGKDNEKTIEVKLPFNYKENRETTRMRKVVQAYNRLLDNTHIDCDAACIADDDRADVVERLKAYKKNQKPEIRIKLLSKNVYRVFNDRRWDHGGRFYGAWWIGCPSELRKYITLNGEPTVELDYSGIHIHMLYALKGINYAAKKEDPYTLDDGLPDRKLNKLILLTALNAENETKARDSVYDELRKDKELEKYELTTKEPLLRKLILLKEKHALIADYIASGEGIKLQYLDSCVIEKLIVYALRYKIPILTIHDSVICPARYADFVKDKMWSYFTELISEKLGLIISYNNVGPRAKHEIVRLAEHIHKPKLPVDYAIHNPVLGRYHPDTNAVRAWLKPDDIIKIKSDARANSCTGKCKHHMRVVNYKNNKRSYLGKIVVKLLGRETEAKLVMED